MSWFFYAVLATLFFTLYDLVSRIFGAKSKNPRIFCVIYNTVVACMALFLFFISPTKPSNINFFILILGIIGLIVWAIFGRLEYFAHKYIEASLLTVIVRIAYIITFLASIIFLGEPVTIQKIVAIILIVIANLLIFGRLKNKKINKGIIYGLLLAVFLGGGWVIDKVVSSKWGLSFYTFLSFLSPAFLNSISPIIKKKELVSEIKNTSKFIFLLGFFNLGGYYFLLKAFSLGEASRVILVTSFAQILTIISGVILLKEREHILQKILAGIIGVIALILLNS